jgi:hypothetical protein
VKVVLHPRDAFLLIEELGYGKNHGPLLPHDAQIDYLSHNMLLALSIDKEKALDISRA